ncbi:MAG: sulfatase-like hydrolase/transferase [Verrucomicrobiota bacterium JB024]|nr:sulfatase-like hydrolase/transferase [Verrucomicrobiota bacterium JB024]
MTTTPLPSRKNLLLITTDQQRFDTIAAAGNTSIFTPHLDWLCDEGIRYARAYSDCPICVPARATIMTGTHAWNLGLTDNHDRHHCMANRPTLPGVLTRTGYQTRAEGKMHFTPPRAHYGFEHMEILQDYYRSTQHAGGPPPLHHGVGQNEMQPVFDTCEDHRTLTNWTVDRSIDFLETRDATRPFFLWTSFADPHPPFAPPQSAWEIYNGITLPEPACGDWAETDEGPLTAWRNYTCKLSGADRFSREQWQSVRRAYYACLTHIDYSLGRLFARLRELGLLEDTWIVFTSDHGEMLGDHRLAAKGQYLEGAAHVPLIIRPPSNAPGYDEHRGTTDDRLACLADLMPTFLNRAQDNLVPNGLDGLDLLGQGQRGHLFGSCGPFHAVIEGDWKYQFCEMGGGELLFNLRDDPGELRNRVGDPSSADTCSSLKEKMIGHLKQTGSAAVKSGNLQATTPLPSAREARSRSWRGFHSEHELSDVLH